MIKTEIDRQGFRRRLLEAIARKTGQPQGKHWTLVAREAKIGISVFQNYLDETSPAEPRGDNLMRLARVLNVTPEWLIYGTTTERTPAFVVGRRTRPATIADQVPVYPLGVKWSKENRPEGRPLFQITRTVDNEDPQAYAVLIEGNVLAPRFWSGDVIEVRTNGDVRTGHIALALDQDGQVYIRQVSVHNRAERVALLPWGPGDSVVEIPYTHLRVLHRVVTIRAHGTY